MRILVRFWGKNSKDSHGSAPLNAWMGTWISAACEAHMSELVNLLPLMSSLQDIHAAPKGSPPSCAVTCDTFWVLIACYLYICRYGDKYAVTPAARILTGIWMLTGLIIQGMFVATVTMSLVSQSLDVDFKLYGSEVIPFHHFSRVRRLVRIASNRRVVFGFHMNALIPSIEQQG